MNAHLDETTLQRLIKIAGMFGSDHDGERAVAARMANDIVQARKLTWRDILIPRLPAPEREPPRHWREPRSDSDAIAISREHCEHLNEWERGFVTSLRGPLSHKQRMKLVQIIDKLRAILAQEAA